MRLWQAVDEKWRPCGYQEQVIRVGRTGIKLPGLIPLPRGLIFGMNQQTTNASDVSRLCGAQQRVPEPRLAQTFSLMIAIHCQPCQDHDRHRMPGQALHDACWSILRINTSDRQTVEAHDLAAKARHVGMGAIRLLAQAVILTSLAAVF